MYIRLIISVAPLVIGFVLGGLVIPKLGFEHYFWQIVLPLSVIYGGGIYLVQKRVWPFRKDFPEFRGEDLHTGQLLNDSVNLLRRFRFELIWNEFFEDMGRGMQLWANQRYDMLLVLWYQDQPGRGLEKTERVYSCGTLYGRILLTGVDHGRFFELSDNYFIEWTVRDEPGMSSSAYICLDKILEACWSIRNGKFKPLPWDYRTRHVCLSLPTGERCEDTEYDVELMHGVIMDRNTPQWARNFMTGVTQS